MPSFIPTVLRVWSSWLTNRFYIRVRRRRMSIKTEELQSQVLATIAVQLTKQ